MATSVDCQVVVQCVTLIGSLCLAALVEWYGFEGASVQWKLSTGCNAFNAWMLPASLIRMIRLLKQSNGW